jgi:hypothetical protein
MPNVIRGRCCERQGRIKHLHFQPISAGYTHAGHVKTLNACTYVNLTTILEIGVHQTTIILIGFGILGYIYIYKKYNINSYILKY